MRQELQVRQQTALLLSIEMKQSLQVLELPIQELKTWLENELQIERPSYEGFRAKTCPHELSFSPSSFETLMQQARLELPEEEWEVAEWIIGNLDERGFFLEPLPNKQLPILQKIQEISPPGIAARGLKECLLLQLKHKKEGLAYKLIQDHLEDLTHGHFKPLLKKFSLSFSALKKIVQKEILSLNFCPAALFSAPKVLPLLPDIILEKEEQGWLVRTNEEELGESFAVLKKSSKGLCKAIEKRMFTLKRIALALVEKMPDFFEGKVRYPSALTIREMASDLSLHESTVARAISGKTLFCIHGMVCMRTLFTSTLETATGDLISNRLAHEMLKELVEKEEKEAPLSDLALSKKMRQAGIFCARRTVAKYRKQLRIFSASRRKKFLEQSWQSLDEIKGKVQNVIDK